MDQQAVFAEHYLDLDGLRYHYLDEGAGEAIVMIHGNPTWSYYYRNLVRAFSDDYRVVVPDHIGCGFSDKPPESEYAYDLATRIADLDRLIEHLQLDSFTLVVHDWGGMIGAAWAVEHPERIDRLVVLNSAAFPMPQGTSLSPWLRTARVPLLGKLLVRGIGAFSRVANRICVGTKRMSAEVADAYLAPYDSWANRVAVHRFVLDIPLSPGHPSFAIVRNTAERLGQLADIPMLICWGLRDQVLNRRFLAEWTQYFPRAEVLELPDAGHYVLEGAGDEVIRRMRKFLRLEAAHQTNGRSTEEKKQQ